MILVGELALWIALLMASWGAIVSFAGASAERAEFVRSGQRAVSAAFACLVLATAGVLVALVTSDFSFAYVAGFTTANLPVVYKVAALWAGQAGALLVWTLFLSTCAALVIATNQTPNRPLLPYIVGTLSIVLLCCLALLCFRANPYARIAPIPAEGRGMVPELQNPIAALHAPSLYLGCAATMIPFAFAIAALRVRWVDDEWSCTVQRWATISWVFLTLGIMTGLWWAYVEPATYDRWASSPIRSWAVAPWLGVAIVAYFAAARRRRLRLTRGYAQAARTRTRARIGADVATAGGIILVIALAALPFSEERVVSLGSGDVATLLDPFGRTWTFTSQGVSDFPARNRGVEAVALRATRDGSSRGLITSERRQYVDSRGAPTFDPSLEAGIDHSLLGDTYVVLTNVVGDRADLRIAFHPLRVWVWLGGIALAIGGSMVMWPAPAARGSE